MCAMFLADERERPSDSPLVEWVSAARAGRSGETLRPAESERHMVLVRHAGWARLYLVGSLTGTGRVTFTEGAEMLWIRFRLGVFLPHLPARDWLDLEAPLPAAAGRRVWLHGSAWQLPNFENADTFVDRLARAGALAWDPAVAAALRGEPPAMPERTLRHRFLRATGLTQAHIRQVARAKRAAELLRQGHSILDTVEAAGYFDQPHLTRALRRWVGHTPAQLAAAHALACRSVQDTAAAPGYAEGTFAAAR